MLVLANSAHTDSKQRQTQRQKDDSKHRRSVRLQFVPTWLAAVYFSCESVCGRHVCTGLSHQPPTSHLKDREVAMKVDSLGASPEMESFPSDAHGCLARLQPP
jgi:hypothetical protein